MDGWIGVDLDGTLAEYNHWKGATVIGKPIPAMVERVKKWLIKGINVKIFTARIWPLELADKGGIDPARIQEAQDAKNAIYRWCLDVFDRPLPITCVKDYGMVTLYDDRAVGVQQNTGKLVGVNE